MNDIVNSLLMELNNIGKVFFNYAAGIFIQTAILVVVLFIIDLLLKKHIRAVFRYCIWLLVLVKLVLPPTFSLPTGIYYWAPDNLSVTFPSSEQTFEIVEMESIGEYTNTSNTLSSDSVIESAPLAANSEQDLISITWQAVIFVLWLFGVLAFLLILIQRLKFVRGLVTRSNPASDDLLALLQECRLQMNIRQKIQLRVSEAVSSPAVCGIINPVVLIPVNLVNSLSSEGLRSTLIHELAHIKRLDLWINFIQTILQVFYFYNPFVWFANSAIRKVCEEAVDETVLVALGGQIDDYSNTLIDIGEKALWKSDLGLRLIGVAESKKALQWRIKHMLNRPIPKSAKIGVLGIVALFIIAAVLLPMARAERSNEADEITSEAQAEQEGMHYETLYDAVEAGDLAEVQRLIDEGTDVNAKDENNYTPLYNAILNVRNLNKDMISLLVSNGADVNYAPKLEFKPLYYAVLMEDLEIIKMLVDKGAQYSVKDIDGQTALRRAALLGSINTVKFFISKGIDTSSLPMAACVGDLARVKELIEQGIDVDTKDEAGWTGLFWAACAGQTEVADFLITNGADVNMQLEDGNEMNNLFLGRDSGGTTPLHKAAEAGVLDLVELLISKGADINTMNNADQTPLLNAVRARDLQTVELLVSEGADINPRVRNDMTPSYTVSPLYLSISGGYSGIAKFLIDKGADINISVMNGLTLLDFAEQRGHTEIVELLLKNGAKKGITNLHGAAASGNIDQVRLQISQGADINSKDSNGQTPLYLASYRGRTEIVQLLITNGADVNQSNPLAAAINFSYKDIVELLIANGAKVTVPALHVAALRGQEIAELLISNGADLNARNQNGDTPLFPAVFAGNSKLVELLIDEGTEINAKNNRGWTALHTACQRNYKEIVELLMSKGADINPKTDSGQTPLDLAEEYEYIEIIELLNEHGAEESSSAEDAAVVSSETEATTEQEGMHYATLFEAVEAGDLAEVKRLIDEGADVNAKSGRINETALHIATNGGYIHIAELLIDEGAEVDSTNRFRATPLINAISYSDLNALSNPDLTKDMINLLISKGADVNFMPAVGLPPLIQATMMGNLDIVNILVENGAKLDIQDNDGWTPLRWAVWMSNRDIMTFLISKGAETSDLNKATVTGDLERVKELINNSTGVDTKDEVGWTAVFWAACAGKTEIVEYLIAQGSDVNVQIEDGSTPLSRAAQVRDMKMAELLIAKGADLNIQDKMNRTPLYNASWNGHEDVVELLISNNANITTKDRNGFTALHQAVQDNHFGVVEILISNGADINIRNNAGRTPLDLALQDEQSDNEIIELLKQHGAQEGPSSLTEAIESGDIEQVKRLISEGANVNASNILGMTPLHAACQTGNKEIVELLITNGADVNAENMGGLNPMGIAEQEGHLEITELLIKHGARKSIYEAVTSGDLDETKRRISEGADINALFGIHQSLLHMACRNGNKEIVEFLIDEGADVNVKAVAIIQGGRTPLHNAVQSDNKEIVELLISKGADINAKMDSGQSPLDLAKQRDNTEIVELLREHGAEE